ncbi:MAG: FIST N-terminal domain-containing protein [Candidatus Omnitrophota bacterium]
MKNITENICVGIGASQKKDPIQAIREALLEAKLSLNKEKIDLVVLFTTIEYSHPNIIKTVTNFLGPVPIVGCSGAAVISNKGIFRTGLCILLLSFAKTIYFNTAGVKDIRFKTALKAGEELGDKLLYGFHGIRRDLAITFLDGMIEEGSNFIYGLQEKLGTSFPIIGASASDNLHFLKTYTYFNQEVTSNSASAVIWGGKLNFSWGIKHGWKPIGKPRSVTKAKANVVYEIDNAPAAKVYEEYLARNLIELRKELKRISIFYPIGIYLQGEEEYLLRNLHSIENNGSLIFQGNVPEGSSIRLMIGTKESCLEATQQAINEVKNGMHSKKISFILLFDSVSRYILLGRGAIKELDLIKDAVGHNTPIIGIYSYGEQAPLRAINYQGRTHFHNQTINILGITS